MVFHPQWLVSKIWAGTDQNGTFFDNNWRPSWMCHSGRNGCWTGVCSNRKAISSISAPIHHMQESYERVRKCAKVKGRVELKIDKSHSKKPFSYDFPKLHHSNPNCTHHFSLIGHHLESVSRTEPVFELNLALIEKRLTNECRSDSGIFYQVIVLTSQVATFVPGQRCQVTES